MAEPATSITRRSEEVGRSSDRSTGKSISPVPEHALPRAATEEKKVRHMSPAARGPGPAQAASGMDAKQRRRQEVVATAAGGKAAHHRASAVATRTGKAGHRGSPNDPAAGSHDQRRGHSAKAAAARFGVSAGSSSSSGGGGSSGGRVSGGRVPSGLSSAKAEDPLLVVHVDVSEDNLDCDLGSVGGGASLSSVGLGSGPQADQQQQTAAEPAAAAAAAVATVVIATAGDRADAGRAVEATARARERVQSPLLRRPVVAAKTALKSYKRKGKGKKKGKPGSAAKSCQLRSWRADQGSVNRLLAAGTKHRSLWVSGLSISTKVADLRTLFGKFGKVMSASVVKKEDERSLTFHGVVTMATSEEADRCRSLLDGTQFRGRRLEVLPHSADATRRAAGDPAKEAQEALPRGGCLASEEQWPALALCRAAPSGAAEESRPAKPIVSDARVPPEGAAAVMVVKRSSAERAQQHGEHFVDRSAINDQILHQLQRIAADTQRLKEAQAKLAADKEALRLERRLADATDRELMDVSRQRLRLEYDIKELQEKCQRERSDLHRLQELRAKELHVPPNGIGGSGGIAAASTAGCAITSTRAVVNDSPVQGIVNTIGAAESTLTGGNMPSVTSRTPSMPSFTNQSFGADQLLCIGGVLYRVGGGDGNVLVLSRLTVDVQPLIFAGSPPAGGQLPSHNIHDAAAAPSLGADNTSTARLPSVTTTDQHGSGTSSHTVGEPVLGTATGGADSSVEAIGHSHFIIPSRS